MSSEDLVKQKVYEHFTEPRYNRYTVKREHPIPIGSRIGVADVVLLDSTDNLVAIVECKGIGYENGAIDQLKSYLAASGAPLGVFANSLNFEDWICYENLGKSRFQEISQSQFEARVLRTGPIKAIADFLKRMFSRRKPVSPVVTSESPVNPPAQHHVPYNPSYITTTGGLPAVPNENRIPTHHVDPSLNGKPYYSEQHGFDCAAYHRGSSSSIPLHIAHIVYNEEITHDSVPDSVRAEVNERQEQIATLESGRDLIDSEREKYRQETELKQQNLRQLEIKAEAPTKAELEPLDDRGTDNTEREKTWKDCLAWILPIVFGMYLFIFYASAIDKAFFLNEEAIKQQVKDGEYTGIQAIVNPYAIYKTMTWPPNLLVVFFPIVFLGLAKLVEHLLDSMIEWWDSAKKRAVIFLFGLLFVVMGIFVFDVILASQIDKKIHEANSEIERRLTGAGFEDWSFDPFDLDVMTVIFCGFVSALFYSGLWYYTVRKWRRAGVIAPDPKKLEVRKHQIDNEKIDRRAEIEGLKMEIENLQSTVSRCDNQIDEKTRAIDVHLKAIAALRESLQMRPVDRTELHKRVSEFMAGWCRFLAQSHRPETEIEHAKGIAYETLDNSFQGHYSAEKQGNPA
ncbi:MAG: type I restriction enzyme HsdR N-terminal domain-containing protein [Candidatus Poribacteria bacterium]|nr:type I restriction enzyme HsdR N-terminal domain-containing protein [Candidatus Poribacteria bacterium]